jgi:hypothetical protein
MAIINNTLSEVGDILELNSYVAFNGTIVSFTGYTDVLTGVTGTRFFDKIFRCSLDGANWTSWQPLTNPNLNAVSGNCDGLALFQFQYKRAGTDNTGLLVFTSLQITGIASGDDCASTKPVTSQSIFKDLCSDLLTKQICQNLFKKLYRKGIIPEFMDRDVEGEDDEDYKAFWKSISCYFSLFITFAIRFESISTRREYLIEYLKQKGIYFCQGDTPLVDLQYLCDYFFDEIRKRGTILITKKKGTVLNDTTTTPVDGELLRLLCHEVFDEFLFEIVEDIHIGWCVGQSSPCYTGTSFSTQLQKMPNKVDDITTLTPYNLVEPSYITLLTDGGRKTIHIESVGNTLYSGIGFKTLPVLSQTQKDKFIVVDPTVDYEITFWTKRISSNPVNFLFGARAVDNNGVELANPFEEMVAGANRDYFVNDNLWNFGQWYFVRGIIYAQDSVLQSAASMKLNINRGVQLRFKTSANVNRIYPTIGIDNTTSMGLPNGHNIWGLGIRPLSRGKNILPLTTGDKPDVRSLCFLETKNIIFSWMKNNNGRYNEDEINDIITKYLIPYNTTINIIQL